MPSGEHPSIRTLRSGQELRHEVMGIRKPDGSLLWLAVSTRPRIGPTAGSMRPSSPSRDHRPQARRGGATPLREEQEALRALATLVASEAKPAEVFGAAAEHAARVLDGATGAVFRVDRLRAAELVGAWGQPDYPMPPLQAIVQAGGDTSTAAVLNTGRPPTAASSPSAAPAACSRPTPSRSRSTAPSGACSPSASRCRPGPRARRHPRPPRTGRPASSRSA